ncbi:MAG: hypothetical protein ACI8RD_008064, partial [Bacillariaceae sp.]
YTLYIYIIILQRGFKSAKVKNKITISTTAILIYR